MSAQRISLIFITLFLATVSKANSQCESPTPRTATWIEEAVYSLAGLGSAQGLEVRDSRVYVYGDSDTGIIREYLFTREGFMQLGNPIRLTDGRYDLIPHPTGLTHHDHWGTFIGNTVNGRGTIYRLDWGIARRQRNVRNGILDAIVDDAAINGTRPEFVEVGGVAYLATSDYGPRGNEVRLYSPETLTVASRTSDENVLIDRFDVGPWVQNLHWIPSRGELVLVQNQIEGLRWRLSFVDLEASLGSNCAVYTKIIDLDPLDELEGFHMIGDDLGIGISSSSRFNARVIRLVD